MVVIANDPDEMLLGIIASLAQSPADVPSGLGAVVIDLTTPVSHIVQGRQRNTWGAEGDTAGLAAATKIVLGVSNLLAVLKSGGTVPLVIVSDDSSLRVRLDPPGVILRGFLSSADDDQVWMETLDALLAPQRTVRRAAPDRARRRKQRIIPPPTAIPLREDLWFDPAACELLRPQRRTPLTARESFLLAILLRTPNTYIPASELAWRITSPGAYPLDAHSIQQTVSTLRKKLGDRAGRPSLLRVRRGVGYGIFPLVSAVISAPIAADTLADAVEFSRQRKHET